MLREMGDSRGLATAPFEVGDSNNLQMFIISPVGQITPFGPLILIQKNAKFLNLLSGKRASACRRYVWRRPLAIKRKVSKIAAFHPEELRHFIGRKRAEGFLGDRREKLVTQCLQFSAER